MRSERGGRRHQQNMVVLGAGERADGDDAVAAGTVLHHHRLAPFRRQLVRDQPRADIDAAAGAKRQDELHRRVGQFCAVRGQGG